jgi:TrmH family RNA methyltransferase
MITSLHSPHVEAVKALLGSRGVKARRETQTYVIESLSNIQEVFYYAPSLVKTLYLTEAGREKLGSISLGKTEVFDVTPEVMAAMTDTVTPQGMLAVAQIPQNSVDGFFSGNRSKVRVAYFWEIQDPGNAGTVIRAGDAFGFDAVIFSSNSVDVYSPKVVRASAGSLWHVPIFEGISIEEIKKFASQTGASIYATDADADLELSNGANEASHGNSIWVFGNEARGLPAEVCESLGAKRVAIPISGKAESLNLATAASVVMYAVTAARK